MLATELRHLGAGRQQRRRAGVAKLVEIDLVAAGPRWGANQYNNRDDDTGPEPLGIAFGLAGSSPRERTAPHLAKLIES